MSYNNYAGDGILDNDDLDAEAGIEVTVKNKRKNYEKTTFMHKMKVLGALTVLGIFTGSGLGVWYFNNYLRSNVDYSSFDPSKYVVNADSILQQRLALSGSDKQNWVEVAKGQNLSPNDFSLSENFALCLYNAQNSSSYSVVGSGKVATIATQTVYSAKMFDGKNYTFESISNGMLNVASCDYLEKGSNTIEIYGEPTVKADGNVWNYSSSMKASDYATMNGIAITDIQPYLVCDETILSGSELTYDEAKKTYTFTMSLDPIKSVLLYYKQVRRTGELEGDPEFKYINYTVTIDENWQFISSSIEEKYSVIKFGIRTDCLGTLETKFAFNGEVKLPTLKK